MELEDGIELLGADAFSDRQGLREPGGLPRQGLLDAEFASQDIAMENESASVGSALVGAGHGNSFFFRKIAIHRHCIHLGFRIAAPNSGSGGRRMNLIDS
jgi:hypothetical protein